MPHPGPKALISETGSTVSKPGAATRERRSLSPAKFWWPSITCCPTKFPTTTWEIFTSRQAQQEPPHPQLGASGRTFMLLSDIDTSANRSIARKIIFMAVTRPRWHRSRPVPLDCLRGRSHQASANAPMRVRRFRLAAQPLQFYLAGGERLWLARRVPQRIRAPSAGPFLFMARCPVPPT